MGVFVTFSDIGRKKEPNKLTAKKSLCYCESMNKMELIPKKFSGMLDIRFFAIGAWAKKAACVVVCICLLPLSGCMSWSQRQKAGQNVSLARPIVHQYLEQNYAGGRIKSSVSLNHLGGDGPIPNFNRYASSYVKSLVIVDKREFSVLVNVDTGQCYDNYNAQYTTEDLKEYTVSSLSIAAPQDTEVHFYPRDLKGAIKSSEYMGFAEFGVKTAGDLFAADKYQLYVVCKYIASDMDFGSVDVRRFFPEAEGTNMYLALVNFRHKDRYIDGTITSLSSFGFSQQQYYYSLSDVVTAYKTVDSNQKSLEQDDNVNYKYDRYASNTVNGIEIVWNASAYALDIKEVPVEEINRTQTYEGETFYSADGKAASIQCTSLSDTIKKQDSDIYFFFGEDLYKKQILLTRYDEFGEKNELWTLDWRADHYLYRSLYARGKNASLLLGFYEKTAK